MNCRIHIALAALMVVSLSPANANPFWSDEFLIGQFNKYNDIQIHAGGVKRKHKVLQKLEVDLQKGAPQYGGYRGVTDVMRVMARQAEALGAHAIKQFKYVDVPISLLSYGSISGTGVAIRYHNGPPARKRPAPNPNSRRNASEPDGGR